MAQTHGKLSPLIEIYCINCHEELLLNLAERRGEEPIVCPKCRTSFNLSEAKKFLENVSPRTEGQCPSCSKDLTFDIEDRINKGKIKCPACKDFFYMTEVLRSPTQVTDKKEIRKNPIATSHSKEDGNNLGKITENLEQAYKEGYVEGYKTSLSLFSKLFEKMEGKNELKSKDFISDIWHKVNVIQDKKDFSNIYTLNIPEDSSKEEKIFLKKFLAARNRNFEEGYKEGQLVLVKLYLSFNKKFYLKKETLIKEVRKELVELMKPIQDLN